MGGDYRLFVFNRCMNFLNIVTRMAAVWSVNLGKRVNLSQDQLTKIGWKENKTQKLEVSVQLNIIPIYVWESIRDSARVVGAPSNQIILASPHKKFPIILSLITFNTYVYIFFCFALSGLYNSLLLICSTTLNMLSVLLFLLLFILLFFFSSSFPA